ncbi:hypothetical protein [Methanosarcina siciliae]|uniref:hypothetical protein n=1 Tax=Methanosarcina siciliae TaxID=38027 RepID=UPI000A3FA376|nr:hypothetical protein [Methanosarcina siciliae]
MTTINNYNFNFSEFKPETIEAFKRICSEKRELLEHLSKFGSDFEKAAAGIVLKAGEAV